MRTSDSFCYQSPLPDDLFGHFSLFPGEIRSLFERNFVSRTLHPPIELRSSQLHILKKNFGQCEKLCVELVIEIYVFSKDI